MRTMRKLLSFMLVCSLLLSFSGLASAASGVKTNVAEDGRIQIVLDFNDIQEAQWAAAYIAKMKSKNVFQGYEDGTFRPNQPVKRAEAIATAVRLLGLENEAKAIPLDTKIHFKDADLIDRKFPWAKGSIVIGLENGLFDESEDSIQPDKPASRLWVARLLVKSLGLQAEALREMNKTPDFTDADQIPAGSIGYVNVAVEQGIVSGYPNGTFRPNTNVTRAEMATLLDRTGVALMVNDGATEVNGTILDIHFNSSNVTSSGSSSDTVAESVYGSVNGEVTISTDGQDSLTYGISSELLVQYHDKFIHADQLAVNDYVHLILQGNTVIEASLTNPKEVDQEEADQGKSNQEESDDNPATTSQSDISEFKLEAKMSDEGKIELEYEIKKSYVKAEFKIKTNDDSQKLKGHEAVDVIEKLITDSGISDNMNKEEIADKILSALNVDIDSLKELQFTIKFSSGKKVKVELGHDDGEDD